MENESDFKNVIVFCYFEKSKVRRMRQYIHTYLAQTPEIGQGLGRILSCGARKPEQS